MGTFEEISLTRGLVAVVDRDDYAPLSRFSWYALKCRSNYYAYRSSGNKKISMARQLLNPSPGMVIDHINHDTLDNRRSNLRICTKSQNSRNRVNFNPKSKSGIRGVKWDARSRNWSATIYVSGKTLYLGHFRDKMEAAEAASKARLTYFGSYGNYDG